MLEPTLERISSASFVASLAYLWIRVPALLGFIRVCQHTNGGTFP